MATFHHGAYRGRQREHAKQICDAGAVLPDSVCHLLLRQANSSIRR